MNQIFTFIFNIFSDIFNLLDCNLPGLSLTYIDFILLSLIISAILKLVKGAVGESGDGLLYNSFDFFNGSVSSNKNLFYKEYESYFNSNHIDNVRLNHDEQLNTIHSLKRSNR